MLSRYGFDVMTIGATWVAGVGAPTIDNPLILPLVQPLRRDAICCLWQLNQQLRAQISAAQEAALAQIRLRWWAGALGELNIGDTPPDPLLTSCAALLLPHVTGAELGALADGYFDVAADPDGPGWGTAGAKLFTLTAHILGRDAPEIAATGQAVGRFWGALAAADAGKTSADWIALAQLLGTLRLANLPKPLAAITVLARCIARAGGRRHRLREQAVILRVGLVGR